MENIKECMRRKGERVKGRKGEKEIFFTSISNIPLIPAFSA
jgi:hypothetical protein